MMIRRISLIACFASVVLAAAGAAHAAAPAAAAPQTCTLKDAIGRFSKLATVGGADELAARKNLLFSAADCSALEAKAALRTLSDLKLDDPSFAGTTDRLAERLNQSIAFAEDQKTRIGDVGIRGTKDIARALKEWRTNIYLTATGNVANLDLWKKTSGLLVTAQTRSRQIDATLRALNLEGRDEVKTERDHAAEAIARAATALDDAKQALQALDRPDEIGVRIRVALDAVGEAYSHFFKISDEAKKIVPIGG